MTIQVDFTHRTEPGTYTATLDQVTYETFRPSRKAPEVARLMWTFVSRDGEIIDHVTPLYDDLLWLLKRTLYAVGVEMNGSTSWEFEYDEGSGIIIDPDLRGAVVEAKVTTARDGDTRVRLRRPRSAAA